MAIAKEPLVNSAVVGVGELEASVRLGGGGGVAAFGARSHGMEDGVDAALAKELGGFNGEIDAFADGIGGDDEELAVVAGRWGCGVGDGCGVIRRDIGTHGDDAGAVCGDAEVVDGGVACGG